MTTTQTPPETTTQTTGDGEGKPPEAEATTKVATEYVILRRGEKKAVWEVMPKRVTATNKEAALRKGTEKQEEGGDFKAVAVSAWRGGKRVKKEQVTNTIYEDLDD